MGVDQLAGGRGGKGGRTGEQVVQCPTEGIDIGAAVDTGRGVELFGGGIPETGKDLPGASEPGSFVQGLGNAEVREQDSLWRTTGDQDVARFDIPMQDPVPMGVVERSSGLVDDPHGVVRWERTVAQQGADLTDESGNPIVNSEEMVKAMTLLKDLQDNNVIATIAGGQPDTEEAYGEFNAGNYATAFMPLWQMSRYTNYMPDLSGKIAIAPIPVMEEGMPRSVGGGGTGTVVTKTAKDVKLAKDFLAFAKLSLDANKEIWNTLGFDPVNMDVWEMKDVTHNPENQFVKYFVNNPFDVLNELKDEIRLIKSTSASPTINNVLCTTTFNEIFEDGKDIAEALNDAQKQIEQELK